MTPATLLALTLFLLPLQLSPGPANLYFASLAGRFGVRGAVPALLGYLTGAFALTVLIGLGLDAALFGRPEIMRPMQLAGAAYMLWLAWSFLKADGDSDAESSPQARSPLAGALVLLLNPKAYLIVALTLAQFAKGGQTPVYVVLVGVVVVLTYLLAFGLWAGTSAGVGRKLGGRRLNVLYAVSILLAAVWTAWEALR